MKVYIGPHVNWFGPYQLAKLIMFWVPDEKDEYGMTHTATRVHKFGEWLAHGSILPEPEVGDVYDMGDDRPETWIYKVLKWFDKKKQRKIKVRIDRYDTWSMDHTLAHIILPMLRQLQATKHGSPMVDDSDVPEELRSAAAPPVEHEYDTDDNFFKRWDWVLNEMIFAFESEVDDSWEEQFYTGRSNFLLQKQEDGTSLVVNGADHTSKFDFDGMKVYQARIANGFRLFGKYYQGLWD